MAGPDLTPRPTTHCGGCPGGGNPLLAGEGKNYATTAWADSSMRRERVRETPSEPMVMP